MGNKIIQLELNQKVKVSCGDYESKRLNALRKVTGKVIYMNNSFFTVFVEKDGVPIYPEAFMFTDRRISVQTC